ncbi:MAG: glycosyltransferase [Anaerolineae bacterium]
MTIKRIAMLSVHTSPIAAIGGKKVGGMNVYVRELAQEFARRGIGVDIFTRRSGPEQPDIDRSLGENVRVIHLLAGPPQPLDPDDVYGHLSQFTAGLIAFATRQGIGYDLIYSHYWLSGWVANKLKEVWGTPFIQMFHTLGHMKYRIVPGSVAPLSTPRIRVETEIVRWADRIVAATPAEHDQLLWLYRADRRKIVVIPPGVDAGRFYPIPEAEAKEKLGIPVETNMLLFVGRIEPLKAVDTILQAIHLLRQQNPDLLATARFAIIGGDPNDSTDQELMRLQTMATELGMDDVVVFLGSKDHSLLPYYYSAATAVIMPSDYESFGMVALEAMASGTPVIASQTGGLAFLVRDQETGLLVPVRDPKALAEGIHTLLAEPEKRALLSQQAAALAEQYAWSNIASQLLTVFRQLVPSHHRHWEYRQRLD